MFEYDTSPPLEAVATLVEEHPAWSRHDLSYQSGELERVQAWFFLPAGAAVHPFTVLLHGGGQDRSALLAEGALLANKGITSLLIDLPQARAFPDFSHPERDHAAFIGTVIGVRRGLDYLASRGDIDITRGGLAGFSFGASIGIMIAATDVRVKTAVLVAIVPSVTEFWRFSAHPEIASVREALSAGEMNRYGEVLQVFDAIEYLRLRSSARIFFQYGEDDEALSHEQRKQLLPFTFGPNRLAVYPNVTHLGILLSPEARRDRLHWLQTQLQD